MAEEQPMQTFLQNMIFGKKFQIKNESREISLLSLRKN